MRTKKKIALANSPSGTTGFPGSSFAAARRRFPTPRPAVDFVYLLSVAATRGSADFQICCIAGFQPADAAHLQSLGTGDGLPIGNRRYSRLETCATVKGSPSR